MNFALICFFFCLLLKMLWPAFPCVTVWVVNCRRQEEIYAKFVRIIALHLFLFSKIQWLAVAVTVVDVAVAVVVVVVQRCSRRPLERLAPQSSTAGEEDIKRVAGYTVIAKFQQRSALIHLADLCTSIARPKKTRRRKRRKRRKRRTRRRKNAMDRIIHVDVISADCP